MSSNEEKTNVNEGQVPLTREEADQIRDSAKGTLYVSIAVVLVWLYGYNIVTVSIEYRHCIGTVLVLHRYCINYGQVNSTKVKEGQVR